MYFLIFFKDNLIRPRNQLCKIKKPPILVGGFLLYKMGIFRSLLDFVGIKFYNFLS